MPCVVDLAAMREAIVHLGGDPEKVNPLAPAELVIDHSVQVDDYGTADSLGAEQRHRVRAQRRALRVPALGPDGVPQFQGRAAEHRHRAPGQPRVPRPRRFSTARKDGVRRAYPDTLVGTDSHTTMINGLGVLGWGVGGIEAEAAMLGQPVTMLIPQVIGFKLDRQPAAGRDRHGPRAHRHRDAAQERRGRQVRRVLRRRPREPAARGPRDHRQHGAGVRQHLRHLPDRRRNASAISSCPAARASASRWCERMRRRRACGASNGAAAGGLHRRARARSRRRSSRPSPARSARRIACRCARRRASTRSTPRRRPTSARRRIPTAKGTAHGHGRRPDVRAEGRRGADRGDHELHEHFEPGGDARRPACSRATRASAA